MTLGFIGLGAMGSGMAMNLRKAGHGLVVHELSRERAKPHLEAGAAWAGSIAEVGRAADVVFTSLPGPKEMQAVGLGEGGLLASMRPGSAWIDLTTNSRRVVREMAQRAQDKGVTLLDAPVSGGPGGARSGKLAIFVGGDRATFERHRKLLDAIGDQVLYMGPIGAGTATKLANNSASFALRMMISEIITLGVKAGVDPLDLWHALRQGAIGRSRTFDRVTEYLQAKYEPPSFTVRLAHKDLTLSLELANELGVPMPHVQQAYADFDAAMQRGWGDRDARTPMILQNERAGVDFTCSEEGVRKVLAQG